MFKDDILCVDYRRLLIRITVKLLIDNIIENLAIEHCFDIVGDKVVDFAVGSKPGEVYYLRNNRGAKSNSFEVWSLHNRIDVDLYAWLASEFKDAILTAVAVSKAGVVVAGNGYSEQTSDKMSRIKIEHKLLMIVCLLCRRGKLTDIQTLDMDRETNNYMPGVVKVIRTGRVEIVLLLQYHRMIYFAIDKDRLCRLSVDGESHCKDLPRIIPVLSFQVLSIEKKWIKLLLCTCIDLRLVRILY